MRLFVTGAAGFVGGHFIKRAREQGHDVTGLIRAGSDCPTWLMQLGEAGVAIREGQLSDPASLHAALDEADCVCHFAAAFNGAGLTAEDFHRTNVEGTRNMLEVASARGVRRFVFCSTAGIYGQRVRGLINEDFPAKPWNAYERSKLAAEELVRNRAPAIGMEYVILRPTTIYGPHDKRLQKLFRPASKGRFPLFGPGNGRRHMVYVTDVAEAFLRACTRAEAAGKEMIIAGPAAVPLHELLRTVAAVAGRRRYGPRLPLWPAITLAAVTEDICRLLGLNPPLYRRRMDFYLNDAAFDGSRAAAVLGYRPQVGLEEGLAATFLASGLAVRRSCPQTCVPASELVGMNVEMFY